MLVRMRRLSSAGKSGYAKASARHLEHRVRGGRHGAHRVDGGVLRGPDGRGVGLAEDGLEGLAAIALPRLDASREHTSRSRWTTRHCQPAPGRHAAMARTSPTWASLTTKRTLESLRSRSARRNPSQPAWVSVSTAATPIMRCAPSDPTPIVVVTADDYTRPSLQHLT